MPVRPDHPQDDAAGTADADADADADAPGHDARIDPSLERSRRLRQQADGLREQMKNLSADLDQVMAEERAERAEGEPVDDE